MILSFINSNRVEEEEDIVAEVEDSVEEEEAGFAVAEEVEAEEVIGVVTVDITLIIELRKRYKIIICLGCCKSHVPLATRGNVSLPTSLA
jgi:hypothetical protein